MELGDLNDLLGLDDLPSQAPVIQNAPGRSICFFSQILGLWMSPEEWKWRSIDAQFDEARKARGGRAQSSRIKEEQLAGYLESIGQKLATKGDINNAGSSESDSKSNRTAAPVTPSGRNPPQRSPVDIARERCKLHPKGEEKPRRRY